MSDAEFNEAKKQLTQLLVEALGASFHSDFEKVIEHCESAAMLATHCKDIRQSYEPPCGVW